MDLVPLDFQSRLGESLTERNFMPKTSDIASNPSEASSEAKSEHHGIFFFYQAALATTIPSFHRCNLPRAVQ